MKQGACKAGVAGCLILVGLLLLPARIQGAPFTLAVLGDSISDTYFLQVSLFERSWTDQLRLLREGKVQVHNKAVGGNTSSAMRLRRQPDEVAQLVRRPVHVGGIEVSQSLYVADGLHPSTIGSGLLANAILEAFQVGHGRDVGGLRLTDREVLAEVGRTPTVEGNFDVSRFVILER